MSGYPASSHDLCYIALGSKRLVSSLRSGVMNSPLDKNWRSLGVNMEYLPWSHGEPASSDLTDDDGPLEATDLFKLE